MISYPEALDIILRECPLLPAVRSPLAAASGGVTSTPVQARLALPSFRNAAMDGYALASGETAGASEGQPVELPVAGTIDAGRPAPGPSHRVAWEIMTGAPLPAGCDAVLPVERFGGRRATAPDRIRVTEPARPGANVRERGQDFQEGDRVAGPGTWLQPHHVMALAATGHDDACLRAAPRVTVISTGGELEAAGLPSGAGQIRDANGPYLAALLAALGCRLVHTGFAGDSPAALRARICSAAAESDVVITTGGVSAGRLDFVPGVVGSLGSVLFHKVAIRPGKPLLLARLNTGPLLFALPGNPLAVAVGMRFFVIPALQAMRGMAREAPLPARCVEGLHGKAGLRFFAKAAAVVSAQAQLEVRVLPGQESFRIRPLLQANCWAIVTEDRDQVEPGSLLPVMPLYPGGFAL